MARIIFVNRYYYPDHSATSQLLTDLASALARDGAEVHVIASRQHYDDPGARLAAAETRNGVRIHRVWTTRFGRGNLAWRSLDYATFYLSAAWRLFALARRRDIVVAKTDPPLISVIAMMVAALRGAALINWVQDLFPEVAQALGVKVVGPAVPLLRRLRNASLNAAQANVVLGERMAALLARQGIAPAGLTVIHNWSDAAAVHPVARDENTLRAQWGLDGKFVVGYSGNMGRAHEFNTLLSAARLLRDDPEIVFLFIGDGARRALIDAEARRRGLDNVLFRPYQPRERLAQSLSVPDLHVVSLQPALEGLIVPSKFYGITAAGRPTLFIGDTDGEIARLLQANRCGAAAAVGDAEGVVRAIRALARNPEEARAQGRNARIAFEQQYTRERALAAWRRVLRDGDAEAYA
jgi:glycosyltransferase involved in cell wall biosynthesis